MVNEIINSLQKLVKGEILGDKISRMLYSTDGSIFEVTPLCIVVPKSTDDVKATVRYAFENNIPVTPRGAGSGLAGQALGTGIIIDFSKYMNKILEINQRDNYVRVQPGVIFGDLNRELQKLGKYIPPNPSSEDYCTIGGMIGNNSSGSRSAKYGNVNDYVDSLEIVLPNGECIITGEKVLESSEYDNLKNSNTLEGRIYRKIEEIVHSNQTLIHKGYPNVRFNVSGYALRKILTDKNINLTDLFIGSEGTLGVVSEAKIKFVDIPNFNYLLMLFFEDIEKSGQAARDILKFNPASVEMLDYNLIKLARSSYPDLDSRLPKNVKFIILVELDGDQEKNLETQVEGIKKAVHRERKLSFAFDSARTPEEKEKLWEIRKAGLPLLYKIPGKRKIVPFIEDSSIDPQTKLVDYFKGLYKIFNRYQVEATLYGHVGKGLLHTRPFLNLKDERDIQKMVAIQEEVFKLIMNLGGSFSGEHGDGRIRSQFIKRQYGSLYRVFEKVKQAVDPKGIMNPDNKITSISNLNQKNWRFGTTYRTVQTRPILEFSNREYEDQIELCHGCSTCTTVEPSITTMCPLYQVFLDERASPKAKANLLRGVISKKLDYSVVPFQKEFKDILDLCVNCYMCKIECPSNVNIPKLMLESKAQYVDVHGQSMTNWLLGNFGTVGKIGCAFSPLSSIILKFAPVRFLNEKFTGISRHRPLPSFSRKTLTQKMKSYRKNSSRISSPKRKVAFFHGCYANYVDSELGITAVDVLEKLGVEVEIPNQKCCGLPKISYGSAESALQDATDNVGWLADKVKNGFDIVVTCTSCGLMLRDYPDLLIQSEEANLVADHTFTIPEYLFTIESFGNVLKDLSKQDLVVGYHTPCHLKAQLESKDSSIKLLSEIPGIELRVINQGCCGIAGSYGFKRENYEISMMVGSGLIRALKNPQIQVGVTDCPTCELQMNHGSGKQVVHPIEIFKDAL